ncbi:MAG: hypothetical protein WA705_20745 [Candidatus Ozemobacteraceae bacterium]
MRFQPAWIVEALAPSRVETIFLPLSPRPEALIWFKKMGIRLFVNHPVESRALLLRALLENSGETFSEERKKALPKRPELIIRASDNVFRPWENVLFGRSECDFLSAWRQVARRIEEPLQRELLAAAVRNVIGYWLSLGAAGLSPRFAPDELLHYYLGRQIDQVFKGSEPVFALHLPFEELGEEVESSVYLLPLPMRERGEETRERTDGVQGGQSGKAKDATAGGAPDDGESPELPPMVRISGVGTDEVFHAWWMENSDLDVAKNAFRTALNGWMLSWDTPADWAAMAAKAGKTGMVACCWSGDEAPPRLHEEAIADPLKAAFARRFPRAELHMKTADRKREDYDFLLTLHP